MPDLSLSVQIGRTSLGLGALECQGTSYSIIRGELGPGATLWKRIRVGSPYVHGGALVSAVKDVQTGRLGVRCKGSSDAALWSNLHTLLQALDQFSFLLTITINGVAWSWTCECADYTIGGQDDTIDDFGVHALQQEVRATFPRDPVPVSGAF